MNICFTITLGAGVTATETAGSANEWALGLGEVVREKVEVEAPAEEEAKGGVGMDVEAEAEAEGLRPALPVTCGTSAPPLASRTMYMNVRMLSFHTSTEQLTLPPPG